MPLMMGGACVSKVVPLVVPKVVAVVVATPCSVVSVVSGRVGPVTVTVPVTLTVPGHVVWRVQWCAMCMVPPTAPTCVPMPAMMYPKLV